MFVDARFSLVLINMFPIDSLHDENFKNKKKIQNIFEV